MKTTRKLLPEKGLEAADLIAEMQEIKSGDAIWRNGKMFGYIYYPGDEEAIVIEKAFQMFCTENALNPSLFGSLRQFENETVQMVSALLHAGPEASGSLTTGGTESIMMAVKTARDMAREKHPDIILPEILIPSSAHPAFDKAAHYLDVKAVHVPVREDFRVDVDEMRKGVTPNTILLVGSSPCFPHGVIDPITAIGRLALEKRIPFHVDACMGGMLLPFIEKLGYPVPEFDFRVPGVTSVSADIHKYGYSPKGASVIIYADREIRKRQFFVHTDWSGGLYGSPTIMGTKCGGPIAAAWATMMHIGFDGYMDRAKEVMEMSERLQAGINAIPGLHVISSPDMSVFAFTSDSFDIFEVGDEMSTGGWHLDRIQFPNALHVTLSWHNKDKCDDFLQALGESVKRVSEKKIRSFSSHFLVSFVKGLSLVMPGEWFRKLSSKAARLMGRKENDSHSMGAAMYGITSGIENRKNVHDLVLDVLDGLY